MTNTHQKNLDQAHAQIVEVNHQYSEGLITIKEYMNSLLNLYSFVQAIELQGLTDPATGLRLPTVEEIAQIDREINDL